MAAFISWLCDCKMRESFASENAEESPLPGGSFKHRKMTNKIQINIKQENGLSKQKSFSDLKIIY
jgi:hypothetical protein